MPKNDQSRSDLQRRWVEQLYIEYETIQYQYRLRTKTPLICLNELKLQLGSWDSLIQQISISTYLIENYSWNVVVEVLKHEMAHQIVSECYRSKDLHGQDFRRACQSIGVEEWAQSARIDLEGIIVQWKDSAPTDEQLRLLRRTEKLLALATSTNEHEALLAMQKVREIYENYNISQFSQHQRGDFVALVINHKKKKASVHQSKIASILNRHFFTRIIFSSEYCAKENETHKTMEILGTRENVLMAEYVYWFLNNNLKILWSRFQKTAAAHGIVSKNNFYLGVLCGFDEQLSQRPSGSNASPSMAPSTTDRREIMKIADTALAGYVTQRHPRLRSRSWGQGKRDSSAFNQGRSQGKELRLNPGIHQGKGHSKGISGYLG